jgi:hypothetical protein
MICAADRRCDSDRDRGPQTEQAHPNEDLQGMRALAALTVNSRNGSILPQESHVAATWVNRHSRIIVVFDDT